MPVYEYECQNQDCQFGFEIEQSIKDEAYIKCPACKKRKLERLLFPVAGFVRKDPTTLGQQAERNMKKMGKEGLASARRKLEKEQEQSRQESLQRLEKSLPPGAKITQKAEHKPWYGKLPSNLKNADTKRLNKYIVEGK